MHKNIRTQSALEVNFGATGMMAGRAAMCCRMLMRNAH